MTDRADRGECGHLDPGPVGDLADLGQQRTGPQSCGELGGTAQVRGAVLGASARQQRLGAAQPGVGTRVGLAEAVEQVGDSRQVSGRRPG